MFVCRTSIQISKYLWSSHGVCCFSCSCMGTEMGVTPKGMLPPSSSLSDTVFCGNSSETLSLGAEAGQFNYLWQNMP